VLGERLLRNILRPPLLFSRASSYQITMATDEVMANQQTILSNQERILANQGRIEGNQPKTGPDPRQPGGDPGEPGTTERGQPGRILAKK
jgi:hypothetical protein